MAAMAVVNFEPCYLLLIMTKSLNKGDLPNDWLKANINAIFQKIIISICKGDRSKATNYRPVSLTCVACKLMEHIIFHHIMEHLNKHNILKDLQHGFRMKRSCETQLIVTIEQIQRQLDQGKQVDMLILDYSKAFDTVAHERLLRKLAYYGIQGDIHIWLKEWLTKRTQRVIMDSYESTETNVQSGVPQGTVLGPLMFLIFINYMGDNINFELRLFTDDSLLYRTIETRQDSAQLKLKEDMDKLAEWANRWQMKFNPQ